LLLAIVQKRRLNCLSVVPALLPRLAETEQVTFQKKSREISSHLFRRLKEAWYHEKLNRRIIKSKTLSSFTLIIQELAFVLVVENSSIPMIISSAAQPFTTSASLSIPIPMVAEYPHKFQFLIADFRRSAGIIPYLSIRPNPYLLSWHVATTMTSPPFLRATTSKDINSRQAAKCVFPSHALPCTGFHQLQSSLPGTAKQASRPWPWSLVADTSQLSEQALSLGVGLRLWRDG